jgi:hypothetical protein
MRRLLFWAGCLGLAIGAVVTPVRGQDKESKSWADRIKFGGDLRLRYEYFSWSGKFDDGDRARERGRLRFGVKAELRDDLNVGFQLRSGNPDNPHSDNQSFDGGFNKKEIAIAEAYVDWKLNEHVSIIAGKFTPKKLWVVSDLQWDDDVTTEGSMQSFLVNGGDGTFKNFEANTYQFILEESGSSADASLFGFQARPTLKLGDTNELVVGIGFDSYSRPDKVVALTIDGKLLTEPEGFVTNLVDPATGMLVSDFRVANAFVVWKNKASKRWPVKVSLFYYKNTGAKSTLGSVVTFDDGMITGTVVSGTGDSNDTAVFARAQVGDYKKPGHVAVRYAYYDSEPDAVFYAFVQSDTRRGSNVDGGRLDVRVGMPLKGYINVTWYHTDWKIGDDTTMHRWQADYVFKF